MSAPQAVTVGYARMTELCDQALESPEGITIRFWAKDHGGLHGAKSAARGFQTTFSGLRAKVRRQAMKRAGESDYVRDTYVRGKYDDLACMRKTLEGNAGIAMVLVRGKSLVLEMDVIDNATGEPVKAFSREEQMLDALLMAWTARHFECLKQGRPFSSPLTRDQEFWWEGYDREGFEFAHAQVGVMLPEWARKDNVSLPSTPAPNSFDALAEIPDDVDLFTGERIISTSNEEKDLTLGDLDD